VEQLYILLKSLTDKFCKYRLFDRPVPDKIGYLRALCGSTANQLGEISMTFVEPPISDEAVKAKTGKPWSEWFAILDAAGAQAVFSKIKVYQKA
jgi:hypothetical protein